MSYLDQNAKLGLACPGCGHKFQQSLGRMERDFDCPACGARFKTDEFRRGIERVEEAIDALAREIGKISG